MRELVCFELTEHYVRECPINKIRYSAHAFIEIRSMIMHIHDTATINELQQAFSSMFPFLRLEFIEDVDGYTNNGTTNEEKAQRQISQFRYTHQEGNIYVYPLLCVRDLEQIFLDRFGLRVEIYRQSGRVWLKTCMTDTWTLEFQNEQGQILSAGSDMLEQKR